MSSLKVIQTDSAGVEWIEGSLPAGVRLCNARGVHDIAVAEWVLAAILAMTKELPEAVRRQQKREWREWEPGELNGSTVLIVGYGSIGHAVADRLRPSASASRRCAVTTRMITQPCCRRPTSWWC